MGGSCPDPVWDPLNAPSHSRSGPPYRPDGRILSAEGGPEPGPAAFPVGGGAPGPCAWMYYPLDAVFELRPVLIHQAQVRLVHQRRRLQGVIPALARQVVRGERPQLVVDQRHEPLSGVRVAPPQLPQHPRHILRVRHRADLSRPGHGLTPVYQDRTHGST